MEFIQGLERQLTILEDSLEEYKTTSEELDLPKACANCFEMEQYCQCEEKVLWPTVYVIQKIKILIHRKVLINGN